MDIHFPMKMARITTLSALFVILFVLAVEGSRHHGRRIRRGFNDSGMNGNRRFSFGNKGGKPGGFDQDSDDDDDASASRENIGGCSGNNDKSGSRENLSYNGRQRQPQQSGERGDTRGNRSFVRSSASATASATASSQNQKKNALS
ncbi:hypothetical protein evm_007522 [Chilo suppressalis]|nr:hypothetical protein evm_007522 [Chilo suppressalis]